MTRRHHVLFWIGGLAAFGLIVWLLHGMLAPFLAGAAIAYFLDPLVDRLERWRLPRLVGALIVLTVFLVLALALLLVLAPVMVSQVAQLVEAWPSYQESFRQTFGPLIESAQRRISRVGLEELHSVFGDFAAQMMSWLGSVVGSVLRGGLAIFDIVAFFVVTPAVAFFLLRDWDRMVASIDEYLPRQSAPTIRALGHEVDATLSSFLRGQGSVCLILGIFYAVALTIVGLDFAIVVGLVAGLLAFIPYVGWFGGFIISVGVAVLQYDSWMMWLVVAGIFIFGQTVEGNYLTPRMVGGSVRLHPVWVIFALMAGGSLLGFTGVLIAVPVAAVIGVLLRFALRQYKNSPFYRGTTLTPRQIEAAPELAEPAREPPPSAPPAPRTGAGE